ncbi:MAG: HigA family addiction module antidote protein [Proteobacteria bacterium]|nr:HigA family addiction module antidote protein [Pseudomonadota bacterium]
MARVEKSVFKPNYAVPPGETLKETIEAIGMTQAELSQRTGRPKKTINEIIKGKAAITPDTAIQLEKVLGVPASFWNNLERNYQETLARLREEGNLQSQIKWLKDFPFSDLVKKGWLPKLKSDVEKLRALLNFFGVAGVSEWKAIWENKELAYRKSPAFQGKPAAVATWLRKGEVEALQIECKPFSERAFRDALKRIRGLTWESSDVFEPEIKGLSAEAGVAVVFVPELPGTHLYGATRWLGPAKALIQLSLRGKTDDHLWFTFFHEAGHLLLHGKKEAFIEARGEGCRDMGGSEKEQEANRFAQDFLIPPDKYHAFVEADQLSEPFIRKFAEQLGIAAGIVVGRLQHEKAIPFSAVNRLKKRFKSGEENKSRKANYRSEKKKGSSLRLTYVDSSER